MSPYQQRGARVLPKISTLPVQVQVFDLSTEVCVCVLCVVCCVCDGNTLVTRCQTQPEHTLALCVCVCVCVCV